MGLGGVAIAVLPYVIHPKTAVLGRAGGANLEDAKSRLMLNYCLLLVVFAIITYCLDFPAHYYRNLWALVLGLWLSLYGNLLSGHSVKHRLLILIFINVLIYVWLRITNSGDIIYLFFANLGLVSLWFCNQLFYRYSLKKGNFITFLAGMSYMVYLIHIKVLTIEWWYIGYKTLLLPLVVIIVLSYLFSKILRKI